MMKTSGELEISRILFDMDGTLCDSTEAVNATFDSWCESLKIDPVEVKRTSHGVRLLDTIAKWHSKSPLHHGDSLSQEKLQQEVNKFEQGIITKGSELNAAGLKGHTALPGAARLLETLESLPKPQSDRKSWFALVTSGQDSYATALLGICEIPLPFYRITSESCKQGKPFPEPYQKGAALLNLDPSDCLVVEDAPAGIASGKSAGCKTLAVCTSHSRQIMEQTEADWIVDDLTQVQVELDKGTGKLRIQISEPHR